VRLENVDGGAVTLEPTVDLDNPSAETVWVYHSEDRCEFAAIVAENFSEPP
jgi:hypothetical protein